MTSFEKWAIWSSSLLVTITGVVYLWMKYLLPEPTGFTVIRHPLQPLVLQLHILTAPLLLLAIGAVALRHIWRHFLMRTKQGRRGGLVTAAVFLPMVFSGYLLQVVTGERSLRVLAVGHIVTGLVYAGGLALHQIAVKRGRQGGPGMIAKGDRRRRPARRTGARRVVP